MSENESTLLSLISVAIVIKTGEHSLNGYSRSFPPIHSNAVKNERASESIDVVIECVI